MPQHERKPSKEEAKPTVDRTVIDVRGVREMTTLGRSTIYALAKKGEFPKPKPIGPNRVVWLKSEVQAWLDAKLAEADAA